MIVTIVIVFECDECGQCVSVKNKAEWLAYESGWHSGFFYDFCPKCQSESSVQKRISEERTVLINANRQIESEVLNAEFIN